MLQDPLRRAPLRPDPSSSAATQDSAVPDDPATPDDWDSLVRSGAARRADTDSTSGERGPAGPRSGEPGFPWRHATRPAHPGRNQAVGVESGSEEPGSAAPVAGGPRVEELSAGRPKRRGIPLLRRLGRRTRRVLGLSAATLTALVLLVAAWVVVPALRAPGNDSLSARIAESARDRGLGFLVTGLETVQYDLNPPPVDVPLDPAVAKSLAAAAAQPSSAATAGSAPTPGGSKPATPSARATAIPVHTPLKPVASPALPGEGVFSTRVLVHGQPALQTALLRPDSQHTSFLAGVVWMSSSLLSFVQHPGVTDPGQLDKWKQPATVPVQARTGLVATFNSAFKIADSRGAFYQDGSTVGSFRSGAASLVITNDGKLDVGAWGTEVKMGPTVRSVRQNLTLLVDGGQLSPDIDKPGKAAWGATIGNAAFVWRSGVGVTATGDVVYVMGDALSARSLATLLQTAGAVRAMELDINRSWVSFMWYGSGTAPTDPTSATPHKLVPFERPPDRYFSLNNRDFFAVYAR